MPKIKAPLLLHYAGLDERINAGIPAFEAALEGRQKTYEIYIYEGANHAFNNDTCGPLRQGGGGARLGANARVLQEVRALTRGTGSPLPRAGEGWGEGRQGRSERDPSSLRTPPSPA